ncbi:MAG: hypothetical protein WBC33_11395, partial [Conexibacter sp.]
VRRARAADEVRLDLADVAAVVRAARDVDLVVSTVRAPQLQPERAVLAEGGKLLSIASLDAADRKLLAGAHGRRGLVVVHAGMHPGVSTLLLKKLLGAHPEADAAELTLTLSSRGSGGRHGMETAAIPLLKRQRRHLTACVEVPAPFGRRRCMVVGDGSEGFFGEVGTHVRRRLYWCFLEQSSHRGLLAVNALGATRWIPDRILLAGKRRVPTALSAEPKCDVVAVSRGGRRLGGYAIRGYGDYAMTVAATVAFAEQLLRGDARGCVAAEDLFAVADLMPHLIDQNVIVEAIGGAGPDRLQPAA